MHLDVQLRTRTGDGAERREPMLKRVLRRNNLNAVLKNNRVRATCKRPHAKKFQRTYRVEIESSVLLLVCFLIRGGNNMEFSN